MAKTREERKKYLKELPRLHSEFNECRVEEEPDRADWDHYQELIIAWKTKVEEERRTVVIEE